MKNQRNESVKTDTNDGDDNGQDTDHATNSGFNKKIDDKIENQNENGGYKPIVNRKDVTDTDDTSSDIELAGVLSEKRKEEL